MKVVFKTYLYETPMHTMTRDDSNNLLVDWYQINNDQQPAPRNKSSDIGQDT